MDMPHLIVSELCVAVSRSMKMPILGFHVLEIVFTRSEEQVTWLYAKHVVACVQNHQVVGQIAVVNQVGEAMRVNLRALAWTLHEAVATPHSCASPIPTTCAFIEFPFLVKSFDQFDIDVHRNPLLTENYIIPFNTLLILGCYIFRCRSDHIFTLTGALNFGPLGPTPLRDDR